jgi:hypothetical protein
MQQRRWHGRALAVALATSVTMSVAGGAAAQSTTTAPAPAKAGKPAAPATKSKKAAAGEFKLVVEPRAMDLLKAMSARLAAAKTMSFTATVGYEYPSKLGPPIVYTTRYDVTLQRPDKLRILVPGDGPASEFYYDGKAMIAYAPAENLAAMADAPPTIDAALTAAYRTAGIFYPFTDLLVADPYAPLAAGAKLAFYVGPSGVVGGTKTDMLVWADDDVFLQVWLGADDKLPRRIRAQYRTDPLRLRHEMELSNWQLDPAVAPETFVSAKAQAAGRMKFAAPSLPPKVKPLSAGRAEKAAPAKPAPKAN